MKKENTKKIRWIVILSFIIVYLLASKFYKSILWIIPLFPLLPLWTNYADREWLYTSLIISTLAFLVMIIIKADMWMTTNIKEKQRLSYILLWIAVSSHLLFYLLTPSYIYIKHPTLLMYQNAWYLTNIDRYLYYVEKYGFKQQTYAEPKTLEDAIKMLEWAKENNREMLYSVVFDSVEFFWYDKAFAKYNNLDFETYFLKYMLVRHIWNRDQLYIEKNYKYLEDLILITNNKVLKEKANILLSIFDWFKASNKDRNVSIIKRAKKEAFFYYDEIEWITWKPYSY